ncbi:MAG TPA: hypothetical protein VG291_05155 [Xanthobacteraceae bacterium]|jgi:hypothetical protein|nr:hypothetical protein [Xanthobacteraceae bacterium]
MIRRGAAPVARYRCIDTDGANIAIRVPKKLFRQINRFADHGAAPPGKNAPPTAISAGAPPGYLVSAKMV